MLSRLTRFGQKCPKVWIIAWITWFITLWWLSSGTHAPKDLPTIPHLDKIAHFGFFFGGAGLLCAWIRHTFTSKISAFHCVWITTLVGAIVGIIDENHQSYTPGRTGNDLGDWLADVSGSLVGAIVMIAVLKWTSAWQSKRTKAQQNVTSPLDSEIEANK